MHVQLHTLTSLPVHVPNRGADGLAKRAVYGGYERQRISYQASQYALRHSDVMQELEKAAGIGHTTRTALVAERLLQPTLEKAGVSDAETWTHTIMALWRREEQESNAEDQEDQKAAPLIVGEQEIRLFAAVVKACLAAAKTPTDLRKLVEKARPPKGTPEPVVEAIEALKTARGSAGLDGALFGRMATGIAVATVDRCVRISDALTTHAITPVADFFLTTDDLKDRAAGEAGGSHINTRELAAGLFYRHVVIDTGQMERNGVPLSVIQPLVSALLTVSPIGNRAPARTVEALVEAGGHVRSLMDAYAEPISELNAAVNALRGQAGKDYELYGAPSHALWLSEQTPVKIHSLAAATAAAVGVTGNKEAA